MKEIEYYLDCSSPWTYLSFEGILELSKRKEFEIVWKPILVGGVFNSINPSVYENRKNPNARPANNNTIPPTAPIIIGSSLLLFFSSFSSSAIVYFLIKL